MRALSLLLVSLLPALAHADDEIAIGSEIRALHSASANAITEDSYAGGKLTVSHALDVATLPGVQLYAVAGFAWGGAGGTMFQTMSTDLSTVGFTVGGRARYPLYPHLALDAGLDLGPQHASLTLTDANGREASDGAWGMMARASLALELLAIDRPTFGFGLRAELGYTLAQGIGLSPAPSHDGDTLQLMTSSESLGHLDLGGPSFGFSAITRF